MKHNQQMIIYSGTLSGSRFCTESALFHVLEADAHLVQLEQDG